jgi:hypothetical protein
MSMSAMGCGRGSGIVKCGACCGAAVILCLATAGSALAQRQVTTGVPFRGVSDSFFERIGFSASFRGPGFTANLGGFPQAVPQFGGFQPGAGVVGGFGFRAGSTSGNVGFEFSQGSRRSAVSQTGSLTMMDGVPGLFADVTQSPFVISTEPLVPLRPGLPWKQQLENGVVPRRLPSADLDTIAKPAAGDADPANAGEAVARQAAAQGNRPIRSVAEIRQRREAADEATSADVLRYVQCAEQAEQDDKPGVAKIYYQMALRRATGELKRQVEERLSKLNP